MVNLVIGDTVEWDEPQFSGGSAFRGRFRGAKYTGETIRRRGVIERESYGGTGQHTFTVRLDDGTTKRVKGRNLYGRLVAHVPGADHAAREIEKAPRSEAAKARREGRECFLDS